MLTKNFKYEPVEDGTSYGSDQATDEESEWIPSIDDNASGDDPIRQTIRTMEKQEKWNKFAHNKCCSGRCGSNVLYLVIGCVLIFYPWVITTTFNDHADAMQNVTWFYVVMNGVMTTISVFCVFCFVWYMIKVMKFKDFDYSPFITQSQTKHIMQILWYNEPCAMIEE
eukprot:990466_1